MTAEHAAGVGGEVAQRELRIAARALLNERVAMATGRHRPANEARAWDRFALALDAAEDTRTTAADTVLAAARRLCCGDNPAPHHAATDAHSQRMAFAEELARAVRGS